MERAIQRRRTKTASWYEARESRTEVEPESLGDPEMDQRYARVMTIWTKTDQWGRPLS